MAIPSQSITLKSERMFGECEPGQLQLVTTRLHLLCSSSTLALSPALYSTALNCIYMLLLLPRIAHLHYTRGWIVRGF
jgi:hypothetical protein